ncbi:MAG TPA: diacylglycerol kinase family protein [Pyrinomonadaceae bacterium]|nr:diacylglycerol kinase family protein [Pyrinomonadaceae bacterium]
MSVPLVIVNPASADGATRENWPKIASDLRTHFGSFTVSFTESTGHARELAAEAAGQGTKIIIACGGDGTISEVANGIIESKQQTELAILPGGTGSDFRRTLGLPTNIAAAARALRDGRTRKIDAGRVTFVNDRGERETRFFINVASFGMSTSVLDRTSTGEARKWIPAFTPRKLTSKLSYAAATLQTTLSATPTEVKVQLDENQERRLRIAEFCVANARYYGGGMKIAPDAKFDDGLFDIVTIGDASSFRILANAPRLYFGAHLAMNEVSHALAKLVTARPVKKDEEVRMELDGEVVGRLPVTFEIMPQALRVRVP